MKLELDIQSTQNQSVSQNSVNTNGFDANPSEDVKKLLRAGINSAKEGNRAEARLMLLQVTEAEPHNETAWLWLASISEYPEELLVFLQNVLKINPENERAIEWAKQTKALLSKTFVQRGIDASHQNQKDFAKQCFLQAIVHDEQNEMAWLWLASSTEAVEEKCSHLQKVLNINPANETAQSSMKSVKNQLAQPLLKKANSAAIAGDHEIARQNLEEAMKYCPDLEDGWILKAYLANDYYEKIACYEKALSINPEHDAAHAGLASLKALAPKIAKTLEVVEEKQEMVEEKVEEVEAKVETVEPEHEPETILETPQEVVEAESSINEPVELFSEVFDAPTGDLDDDVMQNLPADAFSQEVSQSEEVVEEIADQSQDSQLAEESVAELVSENYQVEAENQVEPVDESAVEEEAQAQVSEEVETTQEVSPQFESEVQAVEEYEMAVESVESAPEVSEELHSNFESTDEVATEVEAESPVSFDESVEAVATPDFQSEDHAVAEQFVEEEVAVEESQLSYVEHLRYYQPEEEDEAVAVEETMQNESSAQVEEVQVAEEVQTVQESQEEPYQEVSQSEEAFTEEAGQEVIDPYTYQSENRVGTFNHTENYTDYTQPTVEFSYQTVAPVYTDPSAETLTHYSAQETVAPQPNYFAEEEAQFEEPVKEEVQVEEPVEEQFQVEEEPQTQTFSAMETHVEPAQCPFCYSQNDPQAVTCNSCEAMLALSDLEMLLGHQNANQEVMLRAIEKMEVEKTIQEFGVEELTNLGIAHLNAHNLRKGFAYLQEASQLNPNDVVLSSKVNFLAIRLSEIEEYDQKAQDNPVQSRTIMVVDDSPTVRKLISGKLEKCGHSVVSAVDGMDALAKINEVIPDLVLLDITMPRLDGYQVCKLIRNNDVTKDIPVVMISGKDGFFDKVRGRMAGSSGYITKPFGPDTLMKTIETYLA